MGAFEERESKAVSALPSDLPKASEAAGSKPDGAIFKSDGGNRYRLRHARWVQVTARKPKAAAVKHK